MEFLANENIPLLSIRFLRKAGYKVRSILEEAPGAKDTQVLKQAYTNKLIILTFDRDYGELIYRYKINPPLGVLYFRFDPSSPEEPAKVLLKILEEDNVPLENRFTVIEKDGIRQRPL